MKNISRNIFIIISMVVLLATVLCGCTNAEATNEQPQLNVEEPLYTESCPYSVGDITELGTVIAIGHNKYALLESTNEDGHQTWVLEGGDLCRSTSSFLTGNAKFITFTDEFYFYMQSINTSPDKIYLGVHRLEPVQNDDLRSVYKTIPTDAFTTFPVIERVRYEGNEVWMELRYHISENELAEDTVIYHLELPDSSSFEEVDYFEETV